MSDIQELEKLQRLARKEDIHVLRAIAEDGATAVAALFRESPVGSEGVFLLHVYVRPEYRGRDMIRSFPQYVEEYFSARGVEYLRVRCCGDVPKLEELYHFLVKEAFVPVIVQGQVLRYRLSDWLNSSFMQKIDRMQRHLDNVQAIEDWEDERLQAFLAEDFPLSRSCFDAQFSRFYVVGGRIRAALCAERIHEKLLFFSNIFIAEDCPKQESFVFMLASLLQEAQRSMPEDAMLVVQSDLSGIQNGIREQFGTPESEYLSHKYFYRFGRREFGPETPEQLSGWSFERVSPAETESDLELEDALPLYYGLDQDVIDCLKHPASMVPGILGRSRRNMEKEEDIRAWRKELNVWRAQIGYEPFDEEKALPFEAFLEIRETPVVVVVPRTEDGPKTEAEPEDPTDEVRYSVLTQELDAFAEVLPAQLRERCEQKELIVIVGSDREGTVLSYAAFSEQAVPKKTMYLEYIYVSPRQRRRGLGMGLIEHAKKIFTGIGIRGITAKQAAEGRQAERTHDFFKKAGFQPVSMSSTVAVYYLQSLYDTVFMSLTDGRKKLPKTEEIPDRNDIRLKRFAHECREHGMFFDRRYYDRRFTRFHVKDGVIRAAVSMEQVAENILVYKNMWFSPGYDSPTLRVALLGAILEAAKKRMRDDSVLVLQFDQVWKLEKVRELLGHGESKLHVYEYVLPLCAPTRIGLAGRN